MDRTTFEEARRLARTFKTMCSMAIDCVNKTDDVGLVYHTSRWMHAVYGPFQEAHGVDLSAIWVEHCMGPSSGGYGPSIALLAKDKAELHRWLAHFRNRRYWPRQAIRLP